MELKAHVEHDFVRDYHRVWILRRTDRNSLVYRLPDSWEEIESGALFSDIAPTFEAPTAVVAALAAGVGDVLPPDRAMDRHLRDAVGVRDRLLAIVEHTAGVKA